MALTVEDGSGLAVADSYVSEANATLYHSLRNNEAWAEASAAQHEAALREATDYLDANYDWGGSLVRPSQALGWPRYFQDGYDSDGKLVPPDVVPSRVVSACCELALLALAAPLSEAQDRGGKIKSESIGDLSVTYTDGAPAGRTYPKVDALLRRLITGSSDSLTIDAVRA